MAITIDGSGTESDRPYSVAPKPNSDSRSLMQNSIDRGWDPSKIWDQDKGKYTESIEPWDRARDVFDRNIQNRDGVENVVPHDQSNDVSGGPVMNQQTTFNVPDVRRESGENGRPKVSSSNPFPGMGI